MVIGPSAVAAVDSSSPGWPKVVAEWTQGRFEFVGVVLPAWSPNAHDQAAGGVRPNCAFDAGGGCRPSGSSFASRLGIRSSRRGPDFAVAGRRLLPLGTADQNGTCPIAHSIRLDFSARAGRVWPPRRAQQLWLAGTTIEVTPEGSSTMLPSLCSKILVQRAFAGATRKEHSPALARIRHSVLGHHA